MKAEHSFFYILRQILYIGHPNYLPIKFYMYSDISGDNE